MFIVYYNVHMNCPWVHILLGLSSYRTSMSTLIPVEHLTFKTHIYHLVNRKMITHSKYENCSNSIQQIFKNICNMLQVIIL